MAKHVVHVKNVNRVRMGRLVGLQNGRRTMLHRTFAVDPGLHSGDSYAWHVWLWWLDSFALIDEERKLHKRTLGS
jgi:hypothetical protein